MQILGMNPFIEILTWLEEVIWMIVFFSITLVMPIVFTFLNFWNFFVKKPEKRFFPRIFTVVAFSIGSFEYFVLKSLNWDCAGDYFEPVYAGMQYHYTIEHAHLFSFLFPLLIGVVGLFLLALVKAEKMSPLISCFSIAAVVVGNIVFSFYFAQLSKGLFDSDGILPYCLLLFHIDVFVLSAYHIREQIRQQVQLLQDREEKYSKGLKGLYKFMSSTLGMSMVAFLCLIPFLAVLEIILILCGQGVDGIIQAFTMTADWTFSTQVPPPPLVYDGHYLCTIAAGGHKKVVKPQRYGKRLGHLIIVNRQLSIANAFEELIREKTPRFHRWIRHIYDTYGYPISKHITTPLKADITYIIMKPLEWIFLFVLYLCDINPEERIARQYPL